LYKGVKSLQNVDVPDYTNSLIADENGDISEESVENVSKLMGERADILSKNSTYIQANAIVETLQNKSVQIVGSDMFTDTQCKKCTFFPLCDGGCIVRRYNKKHYNIDYTPCYYDNQNFKSLLDFYYLKLQEKTNIK